jgi:hypothetical protein
MHDEREERGGWIGDLLTGSQQEPPTWGMVGVVVACFAVYGGLAGFFDGGAQIAVAALKAPLIVVVAVGLCLPSFIVFAIVAGDRARPADLVRRLAGFTAVTALIMVALGPVVWLFSVTSRSLGFVVVMHVVTWIIALMFGLRTLRAASASRGARRVSFLWILLLFVVSLQVTAFLGPVLVRADGGALFELRRESFLGRYHRVLTEAPGRR